MRNLISGLLAIILVFSVMVLPHGTAYAQQYDVISTQSTSSLEIQLNNVQKELIISLNKKIVLLKAEVMSNLEARLRSAQMQLIELMKKQVILLQAELLARNK